MPVLLEPKFYLSQLNNMFQKILSIYFSIVEHGILPSFILFLTRICFFLPVLEPNFDLPLGEAELVSHLDAPAPGEVVVRVELLLQL